MTEVETKKINMESLLEEIKCHHHMLIQFSRTKTKKDNGNNTSGAGTSNSN